MLNRLLAGVVGQDIGDNAFLDRGLALDNASLDFCVRIDRTFFYAGLLRFPGHSEIKLRLALLMYSLLRCH